MKSRTFIAALLGLALAASVQRSTAKPHASSRSTSSPAAPQAGFMLAKELGLLQEAGIDLTIEEGKGSGTTAQQVATGQTDVGFADAPAAMQLAPRARRSRSSRRSCRPTASRSSRSRTPASAIAEGPGRQAARRAARYGADHAARSHPRGKQASTSRSSTSSTSTHPRWSARCWKRRSMRSWPAPTSSPCRCATGASRCNDIFYRDVGVPTVGLSIIARDDKLTANPDLYRKFVAASLEGWDEARKNPDAAADAVVEQFPVREQGSDPEAARCRPASWSARPARHRWDACPRRTGRRRSTC